MCFFRVTTSIFLFLMMAVWAGAQPSNTFFWEPMDENPNWDTNNPNWGSLNNPYFWFFGVPWGHSYDPDSGYTGDNAYSYNQRGDYGNDLTNEKYLQTHAIDCSNHTNVHLHFYRWLRVEQNSNDKAAIYVSNNGSSWNRIWENPDYDLNAGGWVECDYDISAYADGQSTVYIRWTMGPTDAQYQDCGWNIDDVALYGDFTDGLAVWPPRGFDAMGWAGGPFTPGSNVYTLENKSLASLDWEVLVSESWIEASPSTGTLSPAGTVNVTLAFTTATEALSVGDYSALVRFRNTGSGYEITETVNLEVRQVASVPVQEGFEGGSVAALGSYWYSYGSSIFSNEVEDNYDVEFGTYHFTMDTESWNEHPSRNALMLVTHLQDYSSVKLSFYNRQYNDEDNAPPASFTEPNGDYDGVFISENGTDWHLVQALTSTATPPTSKTYTYYEVDLDQAILDLGLSYNDQFRILFNHFDGRNIRSDYKTSTDGDGFAFDEISLTGVTDALRVLQVLRDEANPTSQSQLQFELAFTEEVNTGFDVTDLAPWFDGTLSSATVSSFSGGPTTYTLTVDVSTTGSGQLRLDVLDDDSIKNILGVPLGGVGLHNGDFFGGEVFTIDRQPPEIPLGIKLDGPDITNANAVDFEVAFSEVLDASFTADDITTGGTLASSCSISVNSADNQNFIVTVTPDDPSANGTIFITVGTEVYDLARNSMAAPETSPACTLENTVPVLPEGIVLLDATPTNADQVRYAADFSTSVGATFTSEDVSLTATITNCAIDVTSTDSQHFIITVTPDDPDEDGQIAIEIGTDIQDALLNDFVGAGPSQPYEIDNTAPQFNGLNAYPSQVQVGDYVNVVFTLSEEALEEPEVLVGTNAAGLVQNSGLFYSFDYQVQETDDAGFPEIALTAMDLAGNSRTEYLSNEVEIIKATLYFHEPFDYATGNLTEITSNWESIATTADCFLYSGSLSYEGLYPSSANKLHLSSLDYPIPAEDPYRTFTEVKPPLSGYYELYASFLVSAEDAPEDDYFCHFFNDQWGTFHRVRVYARENAGKVQYGIRFTSSDSISWASSTFPYGETVFLVVKLTMQSGTAKRDTASLFVNPVPGSSQPYFSSASATSAGSSHDIPSNDGVSAFAIRQASDSLVGSMDEIRVGNTWQLVTPEEPGVTSAGACWELLQ